jgi:hypothetical protein
LPAYRNREASAFSSCVRHDLHNWASDPVPSLRPCRHRFFYPQFFYLLHEAKEDFLAHIGFPQHEMIKSGFGTPIVDIKTSFISMCPLRRRHHYQRDNFQN